MIITKTEYDEIVNGMPTVLTSDIKDGDATHIDDHITIARFLFGPTPFFQDVKVFSLTRAAEDEWARSAGGGPSKTFPHDEVIADWDNFLPQIYIDMYLAVESQQGLTASLPDEWPIGSSLDIFMGGVFGAIMLLSSFIDHNPAGLSAESIWGIMQLIGDIKYHVCSTAGTWDPPLPDEASTQRKFWTGSDLRSVISQPEVGDEIWSIIPRSKDRERIANLEARIAALEAKIPE